MAKDFAILKKHPELKTPAANKTKLFYHVNKLNGIDCLYIFLFVTLDILAITHRKGYPGFVQCYKIINCF